MKFRWSTDASTPGWPNMMSYGKFTLDTSNQCAVSCNQYWNQWIDRNLYSYGFAQWIQWNIYMGSLDRNLWMDWNQYARLTISWNISVSRKDILNWDHKIPFLGTGTWSLKPPTTTISWLTFHFGESHPFSRCSVSYPYSLGKPCLSRWARFVGHFFWLPMEEIHTTFLFAIGIYAWLCCQLVNWNKPGAFLIYIYNCVLLMV